MKKSLLGLVLCSLIISTAQAEGVLTQHIGFGVSDTYDASGFDRNGNHKDTGTNVDPDGYGAEGNQAPVINSFSASPANGNAPLDVTFTVDVSDDVGTPSLNIDYGDGTSGTSLNHTYAVGSFTATLTATDGPGLNATASASVTAENSNAVPNGCGYNTVSANRRYVQQTANSGVLTNSSYRFRIDGVDIISTGFSGDVQSTVLNGVTYSIGALDNSYTSGSYTIYNYELCVQN